MSGSSLALPVSPALDRIVHLGQTAPYLLRGLLITPVPLSWGDHDPLDTLDYWIDTAAAIPADDPIISVVSRVAPASGLTVASGVVRGSLIGLWISGGTPDTTADLGFTILTQSGRVEACTIALSIVALTDADQTVAVSAPFTITPGYGLIIQPLLDSTFILDQSTMDAVTVSNGSTITGNGQTPGTSPLGDAMTGGWTTPIYTRFFYTQATPAAQWIITHNLNCLPSVYAVDIAANPISAAVSYTNMNALTLTFLTSLAGQAYLY